MTGEVSIALVLLAVFLLGIGETFADTATATLLPMLVAKADLGIANARLMTGIVTLNQLAGPPLGALLFGLGPGGAVRHPGGVHRPERPAGAAPAAARPRARRVARDRHRSAGTSARDCAGCGATRPSAPSC